MLAKRRIAKAAPLGDAHNFGRRVEIHGGRVRKPRTVLWEWLLLSAKSPLRRRLAAIAREEGHPHLFSFLPDLRFVRPDAREGAEVERLALSPLPRLSAERRRELARVVGRSLALHSWLGLSDLHWENLALGAAADGRIVLTPLDVEMILADLALPTETKLLPDPDPEYADVCRHACGVRRVLPYLGKPVSPGDLVAMVAAYETTLRVLDGRAPAVAAVFAALPDLRDAPIRICLRGTGDYVRARSQPLWPPLLDAEAEQLARGDIPYFFRLYGRAGIYYYADEALETLARLPSRGDVPKLDPILSVARHLRSPSRAKLREEGLFTVLGAFDDASFAGTHEADGVAVRFGARALGVRLADGTELEVRRDLRAFVGSVYNPCRCGEVRTVFVPARTRCTG
jgi:hypothetical protein